MLIISDIHGNTEPLVDCEPPKRTRGVNRDHILEVAIQSTDRNERAFNLIKNESTVTCDGRDYIIKQSQRSMVGDKVGIILTAVHKFFATTLDNYQYDVIAGERVLSLHQALEHALAGTDYTFTITDNFDGYSFEDFGDDNSLSLFNNAQDNFGFEYLIENKLITVYQQIGIETDEQVRWKHNIKTISADEDTNDFATYIRGTGKPAEDEDGREVEGEYVVEAEYTSPNAEIFGVRHAPPVADNRFVDEDALINYIKSHLNDYPQTEYQIEYEELSSNGLNEVLNVGDRLFLIHEPLDLAFFTRIIEIIDYPLNPQLKPTYTLSSKKETTANRAVTDRKSNKEIKQELNKVTGRQTELNHNLEETAQAVSEVENAMVFVNEEMERLENEVRQEIEQAVDDTKILKQVNPPHPIPASNLWWDTSVNPPRLMRWDESDGQWDPLAPTESEIDQLIEVMRDEAIQQGETYTNEEIEATESAILDELNEQTDGINTIISELDVSVDGILGRVSSTESEIDTLSGEITSTQSNLSELSVDVNGISGSVSSITDDLSGTQRQLSELSVDVEGITSTVSDIKIDADEVESRMSSAESSIEQNATSIEAKVDVDGVVNSINLSNEGLTIDANMVDIHGLVSFINSDGTAGTAIDGSTLVTGSVTANELNVDEIFANSAVVSEIRSGIIQTTDLDASNITTGTLNAGDVSIINLSASNITAGTLDASQVNVENLNASSIKTGILSGLVIDGGAITQSSDGAELQIVNGVVSSYWNNQLSMSFGQYSLEFYNKSDDPLGRIIPISEVGSNKRGLGFIIDNDILNIGFEHNNLYRGILRADMDDSVTTITGPYNNQNDGATLRLLANRRAVSEGRFTSHDQPAIILDQSDTTNDVDIWFGGFNRRSNASTYFRHRSSDSTYSTSMRVSGNYVRVYDELRVGGANNPSGILPYSNSVHWRYNTNNYIRQQSDGRVSFYMGNNQRQTFSPEGGAEFPGNVAVEGDIRYRGHRTTSNSVNTHIFSNTGRIARSTSARKYKSDIQLASDVDYEKILDLNVKSWYDKEEVNGNVEEQEEATRFYGLIADEFEEVGLGEFGVYVNGEIENYSDRAWTLLIPIAKDHDNDINDLKVENQMLKERVRRLESKLA
ncbi:phage minor structural protein [Virgibacillus natechei]|uniref:Phage minor structural protein n=1 Tax=Virgibacillus natechei TaxID=1216297 RepID=A0ABS4IAL0_9BACI|nr:phage tail spike protein [Virgibacillus natechei]MBP1967966.1 phage minor structural protein [Virgibacillus natechei]UZD14746.1 phage tail protein [Virgibacillus natechei]